MTPPQLEKAIRDLIGAPLSDAQLREALEKLAATEISFSGFTWLFGPELYRRNRLLFRPFILSRFSTYMNLPKWRVEQIRWKRDQASILEAWLAEVDRQEDAELFRRLYEWKLSESFDWRSPKKRAEAISAELLRRLQEASTPAQRQKVLRKFDLWFSLDEPTACALYDLEPKAAGPYILRRLPSGWFSGGNKRELWQQLLQRADQRQDLDFRWRLYRQQAPLEVWIREALELCRTIADPARLISELEKRHPQGWGINLANGFLQLMQARGRDLFPYLMRHLQQIWGGWLGRGKYGQLADYARKKEWWDLWAALLRVCSSSREFNREVLQLVEDRATDEQLVVSRLRALAGASREWNWPGLGLTTVHPLEEPVALELYQRFPELVRGPYKLHVQGSQWGPGYPKLLQRFLEVQDEEMIDHLASRIVTRSGKWGEGQKLLTEAEKLSAYYAALLPDERLFSRRAANVLSQVPSFSIFQYGELIRQNRLARLLFERSAASCLADPDSLGDLVEGAEIHVMALGYRALGLDDERAREQAPRHLPLLLGTLLRPMQRHTRALAFGALANAAHSPESARLILERAREAMSLTDLRYPKEALLGLMGRILHRWPELRGPREQPIIFAKVA